MSCSRLQGLRGCRKSPRALPHTSRGLQGAARHPLRLGFPQDLHRQDTPPRTPHAGHAMTIPKMTRLGSGVARVAVAETPYTVIAGTPDPRGENAFADPSGLKAGIAIYGPSTVRLDGYPADEYCFLLGRSPRHRCRRRRNALQTGRCLPPAPRIPRRLAHAPGHPEILCYLRLGSGGSNFKSMIQPNAQKPHCICLIGP